jgi:hypothetical protein
MLCLKLKVRLQLNLRPVDQWVNKGKLVKSKHKMEEGYFQKQEEL